ncbi:protein ovarian tumor locus-like [Venturia canescens]|uniref:protein ovarian tumor locus-like n=1 Tax=Venturia canescens TaxID=32260 RepID=UPI001C9C8605|nr:protein ovarian tumor locus-like [Venturia canescens]
MDISPRKSLKRSPPDPVDDWLHNEGYVRKQVPRDPTCLFRTFAEQIYSTQYHHIRVRRECVDYMRNNSHLFEPSINSLDCYLDQMACFTEWGGPDEIKAMSLLYKKEVIMFDGVKMVSKPITDNGFEETVLLCHTPPKQYDSVYRKDFVASAAFCQSLVYQTLYKDVFKMPNIEETVKNMLHDRSVNLRHDKFFLKGNVDMREKLTTELLSKIEKGAETSEEDKSFARGITPFPYRVAKALDPSIYRNTDVDIWHELRREVRNGGWTRWNVTELQVGGKCLVQVDYKDKESDNSNNNNNLSRTSNAKDDNGNASKDSTKNCSVKRDPVLLFGHIQEMSKDEGPVVVFIEELGEKRTLPFAALKPIGPRRNKQINWLSNYRRNPTFDTHHKWKKTWNSSNRKSKETSYPTKNPVDRNNNSNDNKTDTVAKTKEPEKAENWEDESGNKTKKNGVTNYSMETYNSCQGFPIETSIDVRPVTVVLDNPQPNSPAPPPAPVANKVEDYSKKSSQTLKNGTRNENPERESPNAGSLPPESIIQPLHQVSLHSASEAFYPGHSAMQPMYKSNQNVICTSPEMNNYAFPCFADEPPTPGSLLDRTIRAINLAVPSSVDANGSDLPYSDPVTLRFFYNLGLEYFRAAHAMSHPQNLQAPSYPPVFVPHGNYISPNAPSEVREQASMGNEEENQRQVAHSAPRGNFIPPRRRNQENPANHAKFNNREGHLNKNFNRRNDTGDYGSVMKSHNSNDISNDPSKRTNLDNNRSQIHSANDRSRENSNQKKNHPCTRYRKNVDTRNRTYAPPPMYHQENYQSPMNYVPNQPSNFEAQSFQAKNSESIQQQPQQQQQQQQHGNPGVWQPPPQSAGPPGGGGAPQPLNYSAPYAAGPIYTTAMPCYSNESEGFFAPGTTFYPSIPFVPAPAPNEIPLDGSPVNSFNPVSQAYPTISENYPPHPPISNLYPPYLYPQQTMYSGIPNQANNPQDNWFPVPGGQPHYVQYPHVQNPQTPPSNVNASASP